MKRFEYKTVSHTFLADSNEPRETWFNTFGAEGWEIVHLKWSNNVAYTESEIFCNVILKREIES